MRTIYKTEDDKEFEDKGKALAYEKLKREKVIIPTKPIEKEVIATKCLKQIFDLGSVYGMTLLLKNEKGNMYEDSDFETWDLDETGHLICTDVSHGLLEWSAENNIYYWIQPQVVRKVELIGIIDVIYA